MSVIQHSWQSVNWLSLLMWPIAQFYLGLLTLRRIAYAKGWVTVEDVPLPVVVVGNLSVGGTGKTPLCAYLVHRFKEAGWKPAIVSRGYGGQRHETAYLLTQIDSPEVAGDEPVMLFHQTQVPVCVCVNRSAAVKKIAQDTDADIVFSDDGLQHLAMPRVAEIVVVDGQRGFGNGWVMPAGPLRDSIASLNDTQYVAVQAALDKKVNTSLPISTDVLHKSLRATASSTFMKPHISKQFSLVPSIAVQLISGEVIGLDKFQGQRVHAVAGIGHPKRFFDSLTHMGIDVIEHPKADHAELSIEELSFDDGLPVLVTAKDAVKIQAMNTLPENLFRIDTTLQISDALDSAFRQLQGALNQLRQ